MCGHSDLRDGLTDLGHILVVIRLTYRVDAHLFRFFVRSKMATSHYYLFISLADYSIEECAATEISEIT